MPLTLITQALVHIRRLCCKNPMVAEIPTRRTDQAIAGEQSTRSGSETE